MRYEADESDSDMDVDLNEFDELSTLSSDDESDWCFF